MILKDLLEKDLDIVFCGTAVGNVSAQKQSYYASPSNQFYSILAKTKLTPKQLLPENYKEFLNYKIGLTDIAKKVSGNDNVLSKTDFDREGLYLKIEEYQPKIFCFNGKKACAEFLNTKTNKINYGFLNETIGKTKLFVAPSTSGSARRFWDESYWYMLKEEI